MTLSQHFVPDERVVKSIIGEVVLDLQPDNIERLSYEPAERWYREQQKEALDFIQSAYLIKKPPQGRIKHKVDMTQRFCTYSN